MQTAGHRVRLRQLVWSLVAVAWCALALACGDVAQLREVRLQQLPAEARQTLQMIQRGGPYPHERDGVSFGNYEKLLPAAKPNHYREYTVMTPGVRHRGARRMVIGCERETAVQQRPVRMHSSPLWLAHCRNGGEFYYTADHYRTFRRVVE